MRTAFRGIQSIAVTVMIIMGIVTIISANGCVGGSGDSNTDSDAPTLNSYYEDSDGDGYGDPNQFMEAETQPAGYVNDNTDCDDTDQNISPGALEICDDNVDNDCDGLADCNDIDCFSEPACISPTCTDSDSDGYFLETGCGTSPDCDDTDQNIHPGVVEICDDNVDNDCDGLVDSNDPQCAVDPGNDFTNSFGMSFKLIPPGSFTMGCNVGEVYGCSGNSPEYQVTLTQSFYMQATEVTREQWLAVSGEDLFPHDMDQKALTIDWNRIQDFIQILNTKGEGTYRLPTEAEWEYTARAGSTTAFSNGDITTPTLPCDYDANLDLIGWYCFNTQPDSHITRFVAQKEANAWGLYDMHGNAEEWVQDWLGAYPTVPTTDPMGPSTGTWKVLRGGSVASTNGECISAKRNFEDPRVSRLTTGFRLVKIP